MQLYNFELVEYFQFYRDFIFLIIMYPFLLHVICNSTELSPFLIIMIFFRLLKNHRDDFTLTILTVYMRFLKGLKFVANN